MHLRGKDVSTSLEEAVLRLTSNEVESTLEGNEGNRVGSRADSVTLAQEVDLLRISALDTDVLDLHAPIHVESLPLQESGNLDSDKVLLVVEIDHRKFLAEGCNGGVLSGTDHGGDERMAMRNAECLVLLIRDNSQIL